MSGRRSSAVVAISDSGVGSRQSALRLVAICRCAGSTRRPTRASDRPLRSGWSSACWYDQHSLRSRQPPCSGASDLGPHTHTARCARSIACQIDYCRLGCFVCCARYKRCCFFLFYRNGSQRARSFMLIFVTSDDWRCMCSAVTTIRLLRLTTQSTCFSYLSQPLHSHRLYYVLRVNSLFC